MQTTQKISICQLQEIVAAIFDNGTVVVREAYSDYDCVAKEFGDAKALSDSLKDTNGRGRSFRSYTIYYPDAKGYAFEKRITLNPKSCEGHTFRFTQEGWGLIQFQCDFRNYPAVECRIAVNSSVRAGNWYDTYPEYQNPNLWDWDVIKKKAGRLLRLLRRLGKQAEQAKP
jgi:hypothetical protein